MKNFMIALVIILGISTNAHATGNPHWTLKGFTVGKPIPANKAKKCFKMPNDVSKVCVYSMSVAGVPSSIKVFTIPKDGKNLIWGISIEFKKTDYDAILIALKEKYGDPLQEITNPISKSNRATLWGDTEVTMELREEWTTLRLVVMDNSLQDLRNKMTEEENRKRASDL